MSTLAKTATKHFKHNEPRVILLIHTSTESFAKSRDILSRLISAVDSRVHKIRGITINTLHGYFSMLYTKFFNIPLFLFTRTFEHADPWIVCILSYKYMEIQGYILVEIKLLYNLDLRKTFDILSKVLKRYIHTYIVSKQARTGKIGRMGSGLTL